MEAIADYAKPQVLTEDQIRISALRALPSLSTREREMYEKLRTFKSLPLTEEETKEVIEKAIRQAEFEKAQVEFNRLYAKMIREEKKFPVFKPAEFFALIEELGKSRSIERNWATVFTIDNDNRPILKSLSLYFTNDERFCDVGEGFSLAKGLLITGDVGCGKTELMSLARQNPKLCYSQHDCVEVSRQYQEQGSTIIDTYALNPSVRDRDLTFNQEFLGRFFDDLGSESISRNFGNERNVMSEIILQRYKLHPRHMTHFTSNLTLQQLGEVYGNRVLDRLREMCNIIEFPSTAKSRRK